MKMPRKVDPWVRRFEVSDPCLHSKGYTIYKITSMVFPRNCPEAATEVIVWKRFSEIKRLHKALRVYHSNLHLKGEFPTFPKEKLFGRFEPAVIEERRQSTLDMLEFVAVNPPLFTSQIFVNFFETGKQSVVKNDGEKNDQTQVLQPDSVSGQDDCQKHGKDILREDSILSGVWQYRQTVDEISIDSNEESDDQDSIKEINNINEDKLATDDLAIFDPYSPSHKNKTITKEEDNVNNAWIISALATCSTFESNELLPSNGLLFPQAFADYEDIDFSNSANNDFSQKCDKVEKCLSTVDFSAVQENQVSKIDYNTVANQLLSSAKFFETNGDFNTAFDIYKRVIETLLNGLKEENDNIKIASFRRDIARHLSYAEKLYEKKLCGSSSTGDGNSVYCSQSNSVSNFYEVQLQRYKVLGVVYRVLLVLDNETNMTYIIKILSKSVRPNNASAKSNFPLQLSHMVQLSRLHETEDSIFLVLQYATGGRLWNFVGSYLQSANIKLSECSNNESQECSSPFNVYEGKKLNETSVFTKFSEDDEQQDINISEEYLSNSYRPSTKMSNEKNICLDELQRVTYSKKDNIVQGVGSHHNSKEMSVHKTLTLRNMDHVNTEDLVSNAQKLMKTVEETLRVSDEITNNLDPVNNVHSKSVMEYDQKRPLSPTIVQELTRARLKNRKTSEGDPFATERSPSLLRESSGSVELQRNRIKHFSSVFQQMDECNSQTNSLPEEYIRIWASEIITAVSSLHKVGIVCKDLKPENILLDDNGHIVLTYFGQSPSVDFIIDQYAKDSLYSAPEVGGIGTISSSCDWWSVGALLYELFTGKTLISYHQSGFNSHTQLYIPTKISKEAESLLNSFLCYNPNERLGCGPMGLENIKAHPFFKDLDWS